MAYIKDKSPVLPRLRWHGKDKYLIQILEEINSDIEKNTAKIEQVRTDSLHNKQQILEIPTANITQMHQIQSQMETELSKLKVVMDTLRMARQQQPDVSKQEAEMTKKLHDMQQQLLTMQSSYRENINKQLENVTQQYKTEMARLNSRVDTVMQVMATLPKKTDLNQVINIHDTIVQTEKN